MWEKIKQWLRVLLPVWKQVDEASDVAYEKVEEIMKDTK